MYFKTIIKNKMCRRCKIEVFDCAICDSILDNNKIFCNDNKYHICYNCFLQKKEIYYDYLDDIYYRCKNTITINDKVFRCDLYKFHFGNCVILKNVNEKIYWHIR